MRRSLALVGLLAVLSPLPSVLGAPPVCAGEARRTRADGWVALREPAFANAELELIDYAVLPFSPTVLFATNGDTVERSLDGGCSWDEVFSNSQAIGEGFSVGFAITALEVPPSPPGRLGTTVYLVRPEGTHTTIIRSHDLGVTWDSKTVGLPVLSQVHRIRVSANPRVAYILAQPYSVQDLYESNLYVTRDGGLTWATVHTSLDVEDHFTDFALDPVDARVVWAWNETTLSRSTDGGATFETIPDMPTPIGVVDVQRYPPYKPSRVLVFHAKKPVVQRSTDDGGSFRTVPSPGVVRSVANIYSVDAIATASDTGVRVQQAGQPAVDVTPKRLKLTDLAFGLVGRLELFGREGDTIYRRRFVSPTRAEKPRKLPPVNLTGSVLPAIKHSVLRPEHVPVPLRPGQSKRVRYTLDLAPTPTPLDVMFATDSTGSMSEALASLREDFQDIINDLAASGIDVWFGVGDFKDYPTSSPGDYPWKRRRAVGPIDAELKRAIEGIETGGGTGLDSSLAASYQAATGQGQRAVPGLIELPTDAKWFIEPGQGAEWRRNSAKVIVMASDVRSRDPQTDAGYPGPSYATVNQKLRSLGIKQVGIAVGPDAEGADGPRKTLERVSKGTDTLAPRGGTDCDDDGGVDLVEGEPLVCSFNRKTGGTTSIAPALVSLLRSVEDRQPVAFALTGDARVVRAETPLVVPDVNVKQVNRLWVDVTFRCDLKTAGHVFPVTIRASAGSRQVAAAGATVACGVPLPAARAPGSPLPDLPSSAQVAAVAVAPLPPPPPAPVTQAQMNPNPNPNPQAQAQLQAGAAVEEQESPQLAFAEVEITDEQTELAMVGRDSAEEQAARTLLWVAMAAVAGAATALERRSRTRGAPSCVTVRR
jgi:hypothetical protein